MSLAQIQPNKTTSKPKELKIEQNGEEGGREKGKAKSY